MLRFDFLERLGLRIAAISTTDDGDCGWNGPDTAARAAFLQRAAIAPHELVCLRQVHGRDVVAATAEDGGRGGLGKESALAEADGLVTTAAGLVLGIHVADCLPVCIVDPAHRACALLHAGRKGTEANIAAAGVDALRAHADSRAEDCFALIGPGAGPETYEVDDATADAWRAAGLPVRGRLLDLWAANRQQLVAAGLPDAHIHTTALDTITDPRFHSYRRDQHLQRNLALLGW